jgi:hypothetical protein
MVGKALTKNKTGKGSENGETVTNPVPSPLEYPWSSYPYFASTFLAGDDFICWVREKWISIKDADRSNIPALKEIEVLKEGR